jgi:hypothetical protein
MVAAEGRSSTGRAPVSKTGGCRFESCRPCAFDQARSEPRHGDRRDRPRLAHPRQAPICRDARRVSARERRTPPCGQGRPPSFREALTSDEKLENPWLPGGSPKASLEPERTDTAQAAVAFVSSRSFLAMDSTSLSASRSSLRFSSRRPTASLSPSARAISIRPL